MIATPRVTEDIDGIKIPVASFENLIKVKELSGREKDQQDIKTIKANLGI